MQQEQIQQTKPGLYYGRLRETVFLRASNESMTCLDEFRKDIVVRTPDPEDVVKSLIPECYHHYIDVFRLVSPALSCED